MSKAKRKAYVSIYCKIYAENFSNEMLDREATGNEIYNAICPKNKTELARRQEDPRFRKMQKRRAQTEARISIVRNGFIGNPGTGRSFGQRRMDTAWAIFTHNVWVVARMPKKEEQELLKTG